MRLAARRASPAGFFRRSPHILGKTGAIPGRERPVSADCERKVNFSLWTQNF